MEKSYRVEKYDAQNDRWLDYGQLPASDVKAVVKGYKKDTDPMATELFGGDELEGMYRRKGAQSFYTVERA